MHDVFVSYARADRDRVAPLVALMEENGLSVWWDAEVVPGSTFEQVIDEALINTRLVVVVWTRESIHSDWVQAEAGDGLERGILLPVMLDSVRVPVAFRRKQTVNLFGWPQKQDRDELARFLAAALDTVGKPAGEPRLPAPAKAQGRARLKMTALFSIGLLVAVFGVREYLTGYTEGGPPPAERPRASILVLPFDTAAAGASAQDYEAIPYEVAAILRRTRNLQITSDEQVTSYLSELLRRPGFGIRTTHTLTGELGANPDSSLLLNARLTDTSTGETLWKKMIPLRQSDLSSIVMQIAEQVAAQFNVPVPVLASDIPPQTYLNYLKTKSDLRNSISREQLEEVVVAFEQITQHEPRFADAFAGLCRAELTLYRENQSVTTFENAEKHCHRAKTLKDNDPEVFIALGALYRGSGMLLESADNFTRALELAPFSTSAMREFSLTLIEQNRFDAAERQLEKALAIETDYWLNYREMGRILFMQGEYERAAEYYEMESELVADNSRALNNLGAAHFLSERFDQAVAAWESIADADRNDRVLSNLGSAHFFRRDYVRAAEMFGQAIAMAPENHEYWSGMGEAMAQAGAGDYQANFRRALELAETRLTINPNDALMLSAVATYQAALGDSDAVDRVINRLHEIKADGVYVTYDIARAYARLGRNTEALETMNQLVSLGYSRTLLSLDANFDEVLQKGD